MPRRCREHREKTASLFTAKYNVNKLIYFESFDGVTAAIRREKSIKGVARAKKIALINNFNPGWEELCQNGVIRTSH